jgi:hypothetical protein
MSAEEEAKKVDDDMGNKCNLSGCNGLAYSVNFNRLARGNHNQDHRKIMQWVGKQGNQLLRLLILGIWGHCLV